jgi:hypothetical protein
MFNSGERTWADMSEVGVFMLSAGEVLAPTMRDHPGRANHGSLH